jgi:hypothetical protein
MVMVMERAQRAPSPELFFFFFFVPAWGSKVLRVMGRAQRAPSPESVDPKCNLSCNVGSHAERSSRRGLK